MKRTAFKRKSNKPLQTTKGLKRVSKQPISKIQKLLWEQCKRIIRTRYPNTCYTCGRTGLEGSNWHTGHLWAKASLGANLKYDLRVLRPQCYFCNVNCGGRGAEYYAKMMRELGQEYMDNLERERQITVKAYDHYKKLLEEYKKIV